MQSCLCVAALTMLAACASPMPPIATEQEFARWAAEERGRQTAFAEFTGALRDHDLWIVDRLEACCVEATFVAPPRDEWRNIIATLRFIRDHVEPAIGEVRAVSAYRDEAFNVCIGGAPASAHRSFYAVDLVPLDPAVTRERLVETLCAVHARDGERFGVGLGIYAARRFHIDTRSFRGWGADHRRVSFPCDA